MAESFKDNVAQSTRCPSCRTPYTDPKVLSCSHIYCNACIDKLIEDRDSNLSIRCIVCQGETLISDIQDASKLPSALAFKNVRYQMCKKHPGEDEECFCLNCRKFVCYKCVVEYHKGESHEIIGSADYESNYIESIKVLRSEVDCKNSRFQKYVDYIDEEKRRVRNAHKRCEGKISEAYDDLAKQLADRKKELIKEARGRTEGVEKELEAMKKSALQYISQLKTDADMVTNRSEVPCDIDSLAVHETLCEVLQETLNQEDPDYEQSRKSSKNGKRINFMRGIEKLDKLVIGKVGNSGGLWCDLLTKDSMNTMVSAPDGMMAVGCLTGGIQIFSADGDHQESVLKDVTIGGLEYLSDDRCVVLDDSNTITLYTPEYTKMNVTFNTLGADEGGIGDLTVDGDDRIYVSYMKAKKIQVFSSEGTVEAEIPCRGYEPHQIRIYNDSLIVSSKSLNNRVRLIDKQGVVKHTYKTYHEGLYPAVSQRNTILIAKVNQEMCMVSIGEYTIELKRIWSLVENFKIEKPERQWYCLQQYRSGELAFCTTDRLYIFY
ncbi:tripartite motif-containing protein 55-like [Lytechinus variegatus]|uniref:tripartite motif-containing protein 55-like n=1 Tax=Lytechinus variegatus TaxID=7654 RepID=UPI001BB15CF8|nr:tripartite motif-containing protein 55-like [Lytechinus variegatus]